MGHPYFKGGYLSNAPVGYHGAYGGDTSGPPPPAPLWGFVIAGQSNAEGYGSAADLSDPSFATAYPNIPVVMQLSTRQDPITWRYYDGSTIHAASGTASPPSTYGSVAPHNSPGVHADCLGPECSLSRSLVSGLNNIDRLVKFTLGGSNLRTDWLNASYPTGGPALRDQFYTYVDAAGLTGGVRAWYWNQGENDAKLNADASVYAASMKTFWDGVFTRYGRAPLIFTQLNVNQDPALYPFLATVRAQQQQFADTYPWSTMIATDGISLGTDNVHYTADSQETLGQDVYAAYAAAMATTTISAVLADSADPVQAGGLSFSYTVSVTNTGGTNAVTNPVVVITLPAGVNYVSASGTGWTITQASGVVTCRRSSIAASTTAQLITINCTSPGGIGSGSMTCTGTIVANNVQDLTSLSETTTLTAPSVTKDSTSQVYMPQTGAEWDTLIALAGLTGTVARPDWWHTYQVASGNIPDASGNGYDLTASGSNMSYQQSLAGWATTGCKWINAATGALTSTSTNLPSVNTTSICMVQLAAITATPSATRGLMSAGTSSYVQTQISNSGPKFICADGANSSTSTNNQLTTVVPYSMTHNKTAGSTRFTTDSEKLTPAISASATGKKIELGVSSGAATAPAKWVPYDFGWKGSNAEISDANLKTLLNTLLNGYATLTWT